MVGVILVSHGDYCRGLLNTCEMIMGKQNNVATVSLEEDGLENFRYKLTQICDQYNNECDYVFILTDIKNAAPYNDAYYYILKRKIQKYYLITGVNLPLLIELMAMRDQIEDIQQFVDYLIDAGRKTIEYVDTKTKSQSQNDDQVL